MMSKTFLATALVCGSLSVPAVAQTCRVNCRSDQIQFIPGDPITVEVINQTPVIVQVEQIPMIAPYALRPRQSARLGFGWGTQPNISIVFWNTQEQPIRAYLSRPEPLRLEIELRPFTSEPSDRSVYIQNDGRVMIE